MDFDFSSVSTITECVWFTLIHPVDGYELMHGGKPVRMAIYGPDSPKMKETDERIANKRFKRIARSGKGDITAQDIEKENRERAVASICGWENFYIGGKVVAFSQEETAGLLDAYPWLERLWAEKYSNAGNFLGSVASTEKS